MADIVIDFDGTCVTHDFPRIGKSIGAEPVLKDLVANGHDLILFTMRSDVVDPASSDDGIILKSGEYLTEAMEWFKEREIPLHGIQKNPTQHTWTSSPKAYGHLIIDDAALGTPLIRKDGERGYVDWREVRLFLEMEGYL